MDGRSSMSFAPLVLFTCGLIAFAAVAADSPGHDLSGVWSGTLGKHNITACFNSRFPDTGNYYYERHLKPIRLIRAQGNGVWTENHGSWAISPLDGDRLEGTWSKPDGTDNLPIALGRISAKDASQAIDCGGDAFNQAIEPLPKVEPGPEQRVQGIRYRVIGIGAVVTEGSDPMVVETIEVIGKAGEFKEVNRILRESIPRSEEDMSLGLYWCRRAQLARDGDTGSYSRRVTDVQVLGRYWLLLKTSGWNKCDVHQSVRSDIYKTFDLRADREVNPYAWFIPGDIGRWPKFSPELANLVTSRIPFDEFSPQGCEDDGYDLHPTSVGAIFRMRADRFGTCSNEVTIHYRDLVPYMTPEGKLFAAEVLGNDR